MKQHPQHGYTLAKYLKKQGTTLPHQAPLLALLLKQSSIAGLATGALIKVSSDIKVWVLDTEGEEDETSMLLPYALDVGLLGKSKIIQ